MNNKVRSLTLVFAAEILLISPALAQAQPGPYDYFLFIGEGESLMMAKVQPDGFELTKLYDGVRSYHCGQLWVIQGKLYFVKSGVLTAIDIASGQAHEIGHIDAYFYDDGRLYVPKGDDWFTYDLRKEAFRKGVPFPSLPYWLSPMAKRVAFSPDKKRLAYFIYKGEPGVVLKVANLPSGEFQEPCPPFSYREPPAGWADSIAHFPFIWLDAENILFVRTENADKWDKALNYLAKADVVTGRLEDVAAFPVPGIHTAQLVPAPPGSKLTLILNSGTSAEGRYLVDLEKGKITEGDTQLGQFRLHGGGHRWLEGLHRPDAVYHGEKLIARRSVAAVSPDGKRIVFMTEAGGIQYYDSDQKTVRTVSAGVTPLLWFTEADLRRPNELPPLEAGWTAFPGRNSEPGGKGVGRITWKVNLQPEKTTELLYNSHYFW